VLLPTKNPPLGGGFFPVILLYWCRSSVPASFRDELGKVATFVLATQCVTDLDLAILGGALVLGTGHIAIGDFN
jgi:hypothetical protein